MLDALAPATGTVVTLSTSSTAITVPSSITIGNGATIASFPVTPTRFDGTSATITATAGGESKTASVVLPDGAYLYYRSDPGDFIGNGQTRLYSAADSTFTKSPSSDPSYFGVDVRGNGETTSWRLDLKAPSSLTLVDGVYGAARRYPFQAAGEPGLNFSGAGRGCNTLTGQFEIRTTSAGKLVLFEQHCEGASSKLLGQLRVPN
jgi:hypothetical protein